MPRSLQNVRLTAVALGEVHITRRARPIVLWIEPTLPDFRKFTNDQLLLGSTAARARATALKCAQLSTTQYSVLQDLQDFIYDKSGGRFTICDLQGYFRLEIHLL
jgi:hypothetical protein